jgi:predicted aldo/keto reductase-like oxidoreductase
MNLRVLNEAVWLKSAQTMQGWFDGFAQTEDQLAEKPDNGAAQLCTECNECLDKCPQSIAIPDMLKKVELVFVGGKDPQDVI